MTATAADLPAILESHRLWLDDEETGQRADLQGADLDFSCLPLWCGSVNITVSRRIAAQVAYHFCCLVCDDPEVKAAQDALAALANTSHVVSEHGLRKIGEEEWGGEE